MSLETILAAIEAAGEAELTRLRQASADEIAAIHAAAAETAVRRANQAQADVAQTAAADRARLLHQAHAEALQITGAARQEAMTAVLDATRQQLARVRQRPDYAAILQRLIDEAVTALGPDEQDGAVLEIDPRDAAIVQQLAPALTVRPVLDSWGGVVVRSSDGRITLTNTLESRLAQAKPQLRQLIGGLLDGGL